MKFSISLVIPLFLILSHTCLAQKKAYKSFTAYEKEDFGLLPYDQNVLAYKFNLSTGDVAFNLKDKNLASVQFEELLLPNGILSVHHDLSEGFAYFLVSYNQSKNFHKLLLTVDMQTGRVNQHPVYSSMTVPSKIKILDSSLIMLGSLEAGDFLQIFDLHDFSLISISDAILPDTRVWDMDVNAGQLDVLLYSGKKRNQYLQLMSFDREGNRLYKIPVKIPKQSRFYIRSAKLLYGENDEYKIVGTYSKKPGEWFSGYYHFEIRDDLEQNLKRYAFTDLEGFYDYRPKSQKFLTRNRNHFNREMRFLEAVSSKDKILLASHPINTVRKFAHFLLLDKDGDFVFDKSIKLYYHDYQLSQLTTLMGIHDSSAYFIFNGNQNIHNLPGHKVYHIENGELAGVLQIHNYMKNANVLADVYNLRYQQWYDNTVLIYGLKLEKNVKGEFQKVLFIEKISV